MSALIPKDFSPEQFPILSLHWFGLANLRRLRRKIEKQHPKAAGVAPPMVGAQASGDEDDDPLVLPAIFKRGRVA